MLLIGMVGSVWSSYVASPAIYLSKSDGLYALYLHVDSTRIPQRLLSAPVQKLAVDSNGRSIYYTIANPVSVGAITWSGGIKTPWDLSSYTIDWTAVKDMQFNASFYTNSLFLFDGNSRLSQIAMHSVSALFSEHDSKYELTLPGYTEQVLETRFFRSTEKTAAVLYNTGVGTPSRMRIARSPSISTDMAYNDFDDLNTVFSGWVGFQGLASNHDSSLFVYDNANKEMHEIMESGGSYTLSTHALDLGVVDAIRKADVYSYSAGAAVAGQTHTYVWLDNAGLHSVTGMNAVSKSTLSADVTWNDFALAMKRVQWIPDGRWKGISQVISGAMLMLRHPAKNATDKVGCSVANASYPKHGNLYPYGVGCDYEYAANAITVAEDGVLDTVIVSVMDSVTGAAFLDTLQIRIRFQNSNAPDFNASLNKSVFAPNDSMIATIDGLVVDNFDEIKNQYRVRESFTTTGTGANCNYSSAEYEIPVSLYQASGWKMRSLAVKLGAGTSGYLTARLQYKYSSDITYNNWATQPPDSNITVGASDQYVELNFPDTVYLNAGYSYKIVYTHSGSGLCAYTGAAPLAMNTLYNDSHGYVFTNAQFMYKSVLAKYQLSGVLGNLTSIAVGSTKYLELYLNISDGLESRSSSVPFQYARVNQAPRIEMLGLKDTAFFPVAKRAYTQSNPMIGIVNLYMDPLANGQIDERSSLTDLEVQLRWTNAASAARFASCGGSGISGNFNYGMAGQYLRLSLCPDSGLMGVFQAEMRLKDPDGTALNGTDTSAWKPITVFLDARPVIGALQNVKPVAYNSEVSFTGSLSDADGIATNRVRVYKVDTLLRNLPAETAQQISTPVLRIDFTLPGNFKADKLFLKGTLASDTISAKLVMTSMLSMANYYATGATQRVDKFGDWLVVDLPKDNYLSSGVPYSLVLSSTGSALTLPVGSYANSGISFYQATIAGATSSSYISMQNGPAMMLLGNSNEVPWVKGFLGSQSYGIKVKPASEHLGSHDFWIVVGDDFVEAIDTLRLEVVEGKDLKLPQLSDSSLRVEGLAVRVRTGLANATEGPWKLSLRIRGEAFDTILDACCENVFVLKDLIPGSYEVAHVVLDSTSGDTVGQWKYPFTISVPTLSLSGGRWQLGGAPGLKFGMWPSDGEVYHWDDTTSRVSYWQYQGREWLDSSRSGEGYWLYTETDASLMVAANASTDAVHWNVVQGKTGWHMVSNPYSWPVDLKSVDSTVVFWAWNPEKADYEETESLDAFQGAWVYKEGSAQWHVLAEPYFEEPKATLAKRLHIASAQEWELSLTLRSGSLMDGATRIGVGALARQMREPPAKMGAFVDLSVQGAQGALLAQDVQESGLAARSWTLQMGADQDRRATLAVEGLDELHKAGLNLWLLQNGKAEQLQAESVKAVILSKKGTQATLLALPLGEKPLSAKIPLLHTARMRGQFLVHWLWDGYTEQAALEVVDLQGRLLWKGSLTMNHGLNEIKVPVSDDAGPAYLRLRTSIGDVVRAVGPQ